MDDGEHWECVGGHRVHGPRSWMECLGAGRELGIPRHGEQVQVGAVDLYEQPLSPPGRQFLMQNMLKLLTTVCHRSITKGTTFWN